MDLDFRPNVRLEAVNDLFQEARDLAFAPHADPGRKVLTASAELAIGGTFISGAMMGRGKLGLVAGAIGLASMGAGAYNLYDFSSSTFNKIGEALKFKL